MKRNLMFLNLVLLALVCWLGWYLRQKWNDELAQESRIRLATIAPPPVPQPPPLRKVRGRV